MNIKKGDTVKIMSGKDRTKTGKVISVYAERNAVLIDGLNLFKKHRRPQKQGEKGEIITVPRPLSASKVMIVCSNCGEASRMGHKFEGDVKLRYCKKCQGTI
ncbi:MAG: 50S ribosomal protein L24 [bacterium]|jgi:large subunit ribosomal protein L24|nr:50S ribosomal protein L24 [bacterium]